MKNKYAIISREFKGDIYKTINVFPREVSTICNKEAIEGWELVTYSGTMYEGFKELVFRKKLDRNGFSYTIETLVFEEGTSSSVIKKETEKYLSSFDGYKEDVVYSFEENVGGPVSYIVKHEES